MTPMPFPVFLDLSGRRCLVIGTGDEAQRKALLLRRAGAEVSHGTDFDGDLPSGIALVIVAGASAAIAESVAHAARERGILVNVVDQPHLCSFIAPAIVDRSPVVIAISTAGNAPALAKLIRMIIERILPRRVGEFAALAGQFRPLVARTLVDVEARRRFWRKVFVSRIAVLALMGKPVTGVLHALLDEATRA